MLKNKKILFAGWGAENPSDFYAYQMWGYLLKKIFPDMISFDTKENYFRYGKKDMNDKFLEILKKINPDCLVMIFFNDEFFLDTLKSVKKLNPKIKTIIISCDEDLKYDNFYKFMSLFFDFKLVSQKQVIPKYKKDNLKNLYFHMDFNTYELRPLKTKKIYDVTFIGRPKADRAEIMEYLAENGIKIALFGWEWNNYEKLKKYYMGFLGPEDYNKVINQTKINLCLTKSGYKEESGLYNLKGKAFEVAQTKSFQLIEYFPEFLSLFKENEIPTFKNKKELLDKINYYLKNEKEREKIAKKSYEKIKRDFNREKHLRKIFNEIFNSSSTQTMPKIEKKAITLSELDFQLDNKTLMEKLKPFDYVCFDNGKCINTPDKNFFMMYSLEKSKAEMSCSDYYVFSDILGDYMLFRGDWAFRRANEEFHKLLDINQLMVRKGFFIKNLEDFRNLFNNQEFKLINKENTIFVSLPLLKIKKLRNISYENMKKSFEIRFIDILLSELYKKKYLTPYPFYLCFYSLKHLFIFSYLKEAILNKNNWDKLILNQKYLGGFIKQIINKF